MTGRISFSPSAMEGVATALELRADHLDAVATDVGDAIAAYRASCGEFVAALPDHPSFIGAQGDLLRGVSTNVLLLAAAAGEADRQGIDLRRTRAGVGSCSVPTAPSSTTTSMSATACTCWCCGPPNAPVRW